MTTCTVYGCNSTSKSAKLFKFPSSFDHNWSKLINKPIGWVPKPATKICCLHFKPTDIVGGHLRPGAVPFPVSQRSNHLLLIGEYHFILF